jgi:hypothetical protein
VAGVHADLGRDAQGLQIREAVLACRALSADQLVRFLLRWWRVVLFVSEKINELTLILK